MIYAGVSELKKNKAKKINGKYRTSDFIGMTKHHILNEIILSEQEFGNQFGKMVLCIDDARNGYWRSDIYPAYKLNRKTLKDESEVDFSEVFEEINYLIDIFREHVPWKVVSYPRTEADDIILILAREFNPNEKILILSPDKDMIQAQRDTNNVVQYSKITKKWISPELKSGNMDQWIQEHLCLGDVSDNVPKVVDNTVFSQNFLNYLHDHDLKCQTPMEFKKLNISKSEKTLLIKNFDIYKLNRKKESTGIKDIFKTLKFGPKTLEKQIETHGSLDEWLDSHPLYRKHYERNFKLVMEEGIPSEIKDGILTEYHNALDKYNNTQFQNYLKDNKLNVIGMMCQNIFRTPEEISVENCGW